MLAYPSLLRRWREGLASWDQRLLSIGLQDRSLVFLFCLMTTPFSGPRTNRPFEREGMLHRASNPIAWRGREDPAASSNRTFTSKKTNQSALVPHILCDPVPKGTGQHLAVGMIRAAFVRTRRLLARPIGYWVCVGGGVLRGKFPCVSLEQRRPFVFGLGSLWRCRPS